MALKRALDIAGALVILCLLLPVFVLIGVAVKLGSPGPVFYRARRVGRHQRPFLMYKFRTMVAGADRAGPALTYKDDPRVTRAGRLLRKFRVDELPQLINVLKGDMSLVGPRPETPEYVDGEQALWQRVLAVRPGICGLAQLSFAFDETDILNDPATLDKDYVATILPAKLALDLQYIRDQSLLLDLRLLMQTFLAVLRRILPSTAPRNP
jgi:lipopolysaccharide/colanic/teichoic acid biosynthesis glycosyltransferase